MEWIIAVALLCFNLGSELRAVCQNKVISCVRNNSLGGVHTSLVLDCLNKELEKKSK